MKRLFDKKLSFTAVFAANDEMALGVYKACAEYQIRIPEQLAVVGVDNHRISKYISPSLSTVDQPKYAMGALILEKLIDQMNENHHADKRTFKLDSELIIRNSSISTPSK
jgi:LacI family transcriptional regulator